MTNLELLLPKLDLLLEMLPELEDHLEVLLENLEVLTPVLDEIIEIRADVLPHLNTLINGGILIPALGQIRPILRYFPQVRPHLGAVLDPYGTLCLVHPTLASDLYSASLLYLTYRRPSAPSLTQEFGLLGAELAVSLWSYE